MKRQITIKRLRQILGLVLVLLALACSNLQQTESSIDNQRLAAGKKAIDSTVFCYHNSTKPSVVITDWNSENKRYVRLYDPFGNCSFTFEDIRSSYSSLTELRQFHENGAVALLTITLNPDGSRYWYTSDITFGMNNEPLWKEDFQHPEEHVAFPGINKSYWKDGHWIKQEIIQEQPVRRN